MKLSRTPLDLSEIGREIRVEVGGASRKMRRRRRMRQFAFSGSISSMVPTLQQLVFNPWLHT
jgi:hypothetical protein